MKQNKADKQHILLKLMYIVLYAIAVFLCSLSHFFFVSDAGAYPELLIDLICFGICSVAAVVIIGVIRKKSILNIHLLKRVFIVAYSLIFLFAAVINTIVYCSFKVDDTADFSINTPFFSNKEVMVFVPHQDDDINITGGVLEQYVENGSRVYVVFSTNGDYFGLTQTRYDESIKVLTSIGIKQEDIIFLGFGDTWKSQEQNSVTVNHIYNSLDDTSVWVSNNDRTRSYGLDEQPCYIECDYTRENYLGSIVSVIKEKRPDVIYAIDYDEHVDHRALDLFFEEAMGRILAEDKTYTPTVYKGFAYGTAWMAEDDFTDSPNLLSTKHPDEDIWESSGTSYDWSERVRVPMGAENLDRMLSNNSVFCAFEGYSSQNASVRSGRVLNGDKVFWERRTDSILYDAEIYADGVLTDVLNDFKLKDSNDISAVFSHADGTAQAERIDVVMNEAGELDSVWLYDNPSAEDNILSGYILFDDGSSVEFGELNKNGKASYIDFPMRKTAGFSVVVTALEGEEAGLTEIEAYCSKTYQLREPEYIIALDNDDNFVYDYWIKSGESAEFTLYSYPCDVPVSIDEIDVSINGDPECAYRISDGKLIVECPKGKEADITLTYGNVSTEFSVSNPRAVKRGATELMQIVNQRYVYACASAKYFVNDMLQRHTSYQVWK